LLMAFTLSARTTQDPGADQREFAIGPIPVLSRTMTLEDHLGDIIRKGRLASGLAPGAAAPAAGLTEAELTALEETGRSSRPANLAGLAAAIGLNGVKLEGIARGWLPAAPDLG